MTDYERGFEAGREAAAKVCAEREADARDAAARHYTGRPGRNDGEYMNLMEASICKSLGAKIRALTPGPRCPNGCNESEALRTCPDHGLPEFRKKHPPAPAEGFEEWHARECPVVTARLSFSCSGNAAWLPPTTASPEVVAQIGRFMGLACREVYAKEHPPQAEQAAREGGACPTCNENPVTKISGYAPMECPDPCHYERTPPERPPSGGEGHTIDTCTRLLTEALPVARSQRSLYRSMYPAWDLDERIDAFLSRAKASEGGGAKPSQPGVPAP